MRHSLFATRYYKQLLFQVYLLNFTQNSTPIYDNCTIIWVLQNKINLSLNKTLRFYNSEGIRNYNLKKNFSSSFHACNFIERLKTCQNFSINIKSDLKRYEYDTINNLYLSHYIYNVFMVPFICIFSIILNILIIILIKLFYFYYVYSL